MTSIEDKIFNILKDLKENYHACSIKAEFGEEATTFDEAFHLKKIASSIGLDFTLKISGAEAMRDIQDSKKIGTNSIVVPMVESPYAARKFIQCLDKIYSNEEKKALGIFINIETHYGFNYLDEILNSDFALDISGIVFGRSDMTASLGLNHNNVNSEILFDYAKSIAEKTTRYNKQFIIGGGITPDSLPFLKKLSRFSIDKIETRKIIFDSEILDNNAKRGILKAIEFELLWLKNKCNLTNIDKKRIEVLENRFNNAIKITNY